MSVSDNNHTTQPRTARFTQNSSALPHTRAGLQRTLKKLRGRAVLFPHNTGGTNRKNVLKEEMDEARLEFELREVLLRHHIAKERAEGLVRELCARLNQPALKLPDIPPAFYNDRPKGQTIIEFLKDPNGWGPYVKAGVLTRSELGKRDRYAYKALENWLRKNALPPDLRIPTRSEVTDQIAMQPADPENLPARILIAQLARRRRVHATP